MNGNGNGETKGEGWLDQPKKGKLVSQKLAVNRVKKTKDGRKLKETVSPTVRYAEQLLGKFDKLLKCSAKEWYVYNGIKWVEEKEETFIPDIIDVIPLEDRNSKRINDLKTFIWQSCQLRRGERFYGAINHNVMKGEGCYLLNFTNCVLKVRTLTGEIVEELKHKAEYMFTASLGEYIGGKDCEFFKEVLSQILDKKEDRVLLLNWFASALLPDSRFECALFCIGNGSNGKSIICETLAESIGHDVRSAITFHQICANNRKHLYRLERMLINVSMETDSRMVEDNAIFNNIVSGEPFETDRIYREGFMMQTNCKLSFLTNHPPQFKYGTEANSRRLRFIQFMKKFDEDNRDLTLKEKLAKDKAGILAMLVRRLPKLCKLLEMNRGSFVSRRAFETFRTSNDIVNSFFEQCIENCSKHNSIPRKNLYQVFQQFCVVVEGHCRLTSGQFFNAIKKSRPEINTRYKIRCGERVSTYACRGIAFANYGFELLKEVSTKQSYYL